MLPLTRHNALASCEGFPVTEHAYTSVAYSTTQPPLRLLFPSFGGGSNAATIACITCQHQLIFRSRLLDP